MVTNETTASMVANSSSVAAVADVFDDQPSVTEKMMVLFSSGSDFGSVSGLPDDSANTTEVDDYVYDYDFNSSFNNYDWAELVPAVVVYSFVLLLGISGNGITHQRPLPSNDVLMFFAKPPIIIELYIYILC